MRRNKIICIWKTLLNCRLTQKLKNLSWWVKTSLILYHLINSAKLSSHFMFEYPFVFDNLILITTKTEKLKRLKNQIENYSKDISKTWFQIYLDDCGEVSNHHIHILCWSVDLKGSGVSFKRTYVIISSCTDQINWVWYQVLSSVISQLLPQGFPNFYEILQLSLKGYGLKINQRYKNGFFSFNSMHQRRKTNGKKLNICFSS